MGKFIFVITILFSVNASGQQSVCDSFLNVLNQQTSYSNQTETVLKWTDGGRMLFGDSLGYYSQKIVEFGIRKGNYDVQALGLMWLALDFSYSDENVSGLQIALRALRLAEHNNRPQLLSRGYLVLSFFHDKEQSNIYANKALDFAIQANELSWQSVAYYTLGMNHLSILNYDSALYYMQQAYQLSNTLSKVYLGFAQQKVAIPNALGNIHMGLRNMALAKTYYYLALDAANSNKSYC
jgi:tetratricopeptide (TPR) repeat protein